MHENSSNPAVPLIIKNGPPYLGDIPDVIPAFGESECILPWCDLECKHNQW